MKIGKNSLRAERWGLLNPYGDLWTTETFHSEVGARAYVADFWRGIKTDVELTSFRPVPVIVTVRIKPQKREVQS